MRARYAASTMASPSSSPTLDYPTTFSAELIKHCRQGCVPPEVFADAQALLSAGQRRRYIRVNPRCAAQVRGFGVEGVLRLEGLSSGPADGAVLSSEEQQLRKDLLSYLVLPSAGNPSPTTTAATLPTKAHVAAVVPDAVLLRLGVAALTGLSLAAVHPVPWLPSSVFSLPWSLSMGGSALFRSGTLIPMDAASIAAVVALQPRRGERVLDLCCAPGMKLGLLADAVARSGDGDDTCLDGLAVGVDVNVSRLYMARATLKKQQCGAGAGEAAAADLPVCAFVADGRTFSMAAAAALVDTRTSAVERGNGLTAHERRALQRAPSTAVVGGGSEVHVVYAPPRARVSLRAWQQQQQQQAGAARGELLFDRVLVDAECSHDGSVAHLLLEEEDVSEGPSPPPLRTPAVEKGRGVTNAYRMRHLHLGGGGDTTAASATASASSSLLELQSDLLYRGYQALRPGGFLVYSTCSYAFTQNELVVHRFLERVNTPAGTATADQPKVTAVLVPAFTPHPSTNSSDDDIAPCVRLVDGATAQALQLRLDTQVADYGVVEAGWRRHVADNVSPPLTPSMGSRFWPRTFSCSFLYVVKIWKKAEEVA